MAPRATAYVGVKLTSAVEAIPAIPETISFKLSLFL
jgi:hypothetical protein